MRVVMFGPPGAGKGTQAVRLAQRAKVAHIASGDLFRENVGSDTELGRLAKTYMDRGDLVPDEVTIRMVLDRMDRADAAGGYVLDGFPRNEVQAAALDDALSGRGETIEYAVLLECQREELLRRLVGRAKAEGRADDAPEVADERLRVYDEQTMPLVNYYESQGKLRRLDGEQPMDCVTDNLCEAIGA
jgi:adenylate kinase